jgi:hypothetical protein
MPIDFYALNNGISGLNGSGLGFYGAAFGSSVNISEYQTTTWITDSTGSVQGPQVHNVKYTHASSGSINGAAGINVLDMPNQLATLNIRFTNGTAVKTQNAIMRVYDRSVLTNGPSGVVCRAYEVRHPSTTQTGSLGSGLTTWTTMSGGVVMSGVASPGTSGIRGAGVNTTDTRHDWYFNLSSSPSSVGSKLFALYFEVEYY